MYHILRMIDWLQGIKSFSYTYVTLLMNILSTNLFVATQNYLHTHTEGFPMLLTHFFHANVRAGILCSLVKAEVALFLSSYDMVCCLYIAPSEFTAGLH